MQDVNRVSQQAIRLNTKEMKSKQTYTSHKQVPAKVTAYVDEGIKELVEVLNGFPEVQTIDSCEGDNDWLALVSMFYGIDGEANLHKMIDFAQYLVDSIRGAVFKSKSMVLPCLTSEIAVSIEWLGKSYPVITIEMPHDAIAPITRLFAVLQHRFSCSKEGKQV
jgi:hypothetical protein